MSKVKFTQGRIEGFVCARGKAQSFLWDTVAHGLGLRATSTGAKSYIFQSKLDNKTIRVTIGDTSTYSISEAQAIATNYKAEINKGIDPRLAKAEQLAKNESTRAKAKRQDITLREVWPIYLEKHKAKWSEGHYHNHIKLALAGGENKKRGTGKTVAAPLASLMPLTLSKLTSTKIADWLALESLTRPTGAAQSFRILRAFIGWANETDEFSGIVSGDIFQAKKVKAVIPENKTKEGDNLQREQLATWFEAVKTIGNPVISAYLQALLITGARRRELSALRWGDVDFQWNSMTIRDKVEGERTIPLTPYVSHLLSTLPRRSEWVFSSPTASDGKLTEPRIAHTKALIKAGLPHVSIHGLRRSFGTLCEWVECPAGISAQIMGHKPSALAEKHYRRRPLDLLRKWHCIIESWILEQAQIEFIPAPAGLRAVK
ncbi:tyrosine-type recombinase/integrase [Undibacterium sp. WLHG33]|uniref:tyrosine-type recombinase/integrase n=1 Tax=Undibacterium sp. WLHG33 TaxID=3412482 RepID=UPI003C2ABECB